MSEYEPSENEDILMCKKMTNDDYLLDYLKNFQDDFDFVLKHVSLCSNGLRFASNRLKNNKEIVTAAGSLEYASDELRDDKEFVFPFIKKNQRQYIYISKKLKEDRDIIIEAVKGYEYVFGCDTPFEIRDDKEVVLEALKFSEEPFTWVSKRLKDDKEVVLQALKFSGSPFAYTSERLKKDDDIWSVMEKYIKKHVSLKDKNN